MHPDRAQHLKGAAICVAGVVTLSPDGLLVRLIATDAATLLFFRGLLMSLALLGFLVLRYRGGVATRFAALGLAGVAAAALFALSTVCFVAAVRATTVANTLFILSAVPLIAAVFSRVFLGEAVAGRTWIASAAVIGGMAVIGADSLRIGAALGELYALMCALGWGGVMVLLRRAMLDEPTPVMALGGAIVALVALGAGPDFVVRPADAVYLGLLGLVVMPVAFGLISYGPRFLPAPEVGLILLLEAILGPLWAWIAVGEVPTPQATLGGAIILGTLALNFLAGWRATTTVPDAA